MITETNQQKIEDNFQNQLDIFGKVFEHQIKIDKTQNKINQIQSDLNKNTAFIMILLLIISFSSLMISLFN